MTQFAERRRLLLHNLHGRRRRSCSAKRMATAQHFVKNHAERKDVGSKIGETSHQHFRRHVTRGPADGREAVSRE